MELNSIILLKKITKTNKARIIRANCDVAGANATNEAPGGIKIKFSRRNGEIAGFKV